MHGEEEWAEAWKRHFHPVRLSSRLVVKPTWEAFEARTGDVVVEIDPGMAFGTGTHPTTAMCLARLEEVVRPGCRFLDVGTGSGILMIAALLLGAGRAVGTDNDPAALVVARENLVLNRVPEDTWRLVESEDLAELDAASFDAAAANITAEPIVQLVPAIARVLAPGAPLVASGIIPAKRDMVLARLGACGFSVQTVQEKDGWCAVVASRAADS